MKKTLVLLLILAVAGGIFAQEGSVSWSGGVDITFAIDLADDDLEVGVISDHDIGGFVDFAYTKGGLELGVGFSAKVWDGDDEIPVFAGTIGLSADYTADNWGAHVEMDFLKNEWGHDEILSEGPTSLWGYYTFMGGDLRFDVAYIGGGNGTWSVSDLVLDQHGDYGWDRLDGEAGIQFTYTGIEGLSFGLQMPIYGEFVAEMLQEILFGLAYDNDPLGVSLMVALDNTTFADFGVWIHGGFKFAINDAMSINADVLLTVADEFLFSAGVGFDYSADPLGVGIAVKFTDITDKFDGRTLDIAPYVSYQINDALAFRFDIDFCVGIGDFFDEITLELNPSLAWDVGGGASMAFGYSVVLDFTDGHDTLADHNLTFAFSWAF